MKIRTSLTVALAVGALALGCHKDEPIGTTRTTSATLEKPSLSDRDRAFIAQVTQDGMLEVALGEHATREASAPDVRAFGEMMVTNHSLADEELQNIAANKGVEVPRLMDSEHRAAYDKLAKLQGKKLDREYAKGMVDDHEANVKQLREAALTLDDPELRAWAAKTLPTLESQLLRAQALETQYAATR